MDPVLDAIDEALARKGLSDAAASKLAVGNYALIKNMRAMRGESKRYNVAALQRLAEVLELEFYFGPRRASEPPPTVHVNDSEFSSILVRAVEAAAGPGLANFEDDPVGEIAFRREWLSRMGINPGRAFIVRVRGDSMEPSIKSGSIALIDEKKTEPLGRIYAFMEGGELRIKRLKRLSRNSLAVLSDNTRYDPEVKIGVEMNDIRTLGEVVWTAYNWRNLSQIDSST